MKNFVYAFRGIRKGISEGPIIKIIVYLSVIALIVGFICNFSHIKFAILFLGIGLSISLEFMNSALEATIDSHSKKTKKFEDAKDISSGSVLIFGIFSLFVAYMLIF